MHVAAEALACVFRLGHGPRQKENYVLGVCGMSPNKNTGTLIRAFARIAGQFADLRPVLVGDYEQDGFKGSHVELSEVANATGVGGRIEFRGYVPDSELASLCRRARAFVMPSSDGGFGLPALEAIATLAPSLCEETFDLMVLDSLHYGTPVIANNIGALEEVVRAPGGGSLYTEPAELERLLEKYAAELCFAHELGSRGNAAPLLYPEHLHIERYLDVIDRLYCAK